MAKPVRMLSSYAKRGENTIYGGYSDERGMSPEKEQFLKDARKMLVAVRAGLDKYGYSTVVKVNKAGPAVSGEVNAYITRSDSVHGLFVEIGSSPQLGRGTDGVFILVQQRERNRFTSSPNLFLDVNMYDGDELTAKLYRILTGTEMK